MLPLTQWVQREKRRVQRRLKTITPQEQNNFNSAVGWVSYALTVVGTGISVLALASSGFNSWSNLVARSRDKETDKFQKETITLLKEIKGELKHE